MLLNVAKKTAGTPEEVTARVDLADKEYRAARDRFKAREENYRLKRICGGLLDVSEGGRIPGEKVMQIHPDPLEGADPDVLPDWLAAEAKKRRAFVPYDPAGDPAWAKPAEPEVADDDIVGPTLEDEPRRFELGTVVGVVGILAAAVVALMLVWRRGNTA
jgi:hypothetical protein